MTGKSSYLFPNVNFSYFLILKMKSYDWIIIHKHPCANDYRHFNRFFGDYPFVSEYS